MGHLTNPIGFRVGPKHGWTSLWGADKSLYKHSFIKESSLKLFIEFLFTYTSYLKLGRKQGFILSHVEVARLSHSVFLQVFLYNSTLILLQRSAFRKFVLRRQTKTHLEKQNLVKVYRPLSCFFPLRCSRNRQFFLSNPEVVQNKYI